MIVVTTGNDLEMTKKYRQKNIVGEIEHAYSQACPDGRAIIVPDWLQGVGRRRVASFGLPDR